MSRICVIGLGYVGLPLAVEFARSGHQVFGFDVNSKVVAELASDTSHIQDVPNEDLALVGAGGGSWTSSVEDLRDCDVYVICVPTPLSERGYPDLSHVEAAAASVGSVLSAGNLVVLESSTHPGTTEEIILPILEANSSLAAGTEFDLAYSPERIDPGNAQFALANTPKVVGGLTPRSTRVAAELYASVGIPVVEAKGMREAELAKLLENTYRHINIALVNELVKFCRPLGIDLWDAIRCASSKPFGFEAFYPGPGVGGHCIPVDPHYLSHQVRLKLGRPFRFVELAQEINGGMPGYVVERIQEELNSQGIPMAAAKVLLLGVTYKRDIADLRETPATDVVRILRSFGANVTYADPFVAQWSVDGMEVESVELVAASNFDAVVLLQEHSQFTPEEILASGKVILDTRAVLDDPRAVRL